ncbi:MAG: glycosyltransferase family 25 protein [Gemmatimonadaceae bacterium]|nr:glycosyltransferase family 25 protein [Gemmatimonadaceae bacterium]
MPIEVISLTRSLERRNEMAIRLDALGLAYQFVDGVDGSTLTVEQLKKVYSARDSFQRMGRYLHPNEIGCALSHLGVWRMMVADDVPEVLVLEDDVALEADLPDLLDRRSEWLPDDARVLFLAHHMARPIQRRSIPGKADHGRALCSFDSPVMAAAAYVIRLAAAKSLLAHSHPLTMPLDDLLGRSEFTGGGIYGITPQPVTWTDAHPSTIWTDIDRESFAKMSRKGPVGFYRRMLRRLSGALRLSDRSPDGTGESESLPASAARDPQR